MTSRHTIRERSRAAVRGQIAEVAMELFAEHGFEATTVDQIAAAAGISSRTFFRYFATKEDVVIGDPVDFGTRLRDLLAERPADEPAPEALARVFDAFTEIIEANPPALGISTIMMSTPALRATRTEKQRVWVELLTPGTVERLSGSDRTDLLATALITSTLAVLDAALITWAAEEGRTRLRTLYRLGASIALRQQLP